jgi:hypothetical protein
MLENPYFVYVFWIGLDCINQMIGVPYGIRTRVASVKGRCPRPLDEGDVLEGWHFIIAPGC